MNEWQPIETASKDGTRILIAWRDANGLWQQRAAWWDAEITMERVDDDGKFVWHQGWTDSAVASFGMEEVQEYEPTRWMPLPDAP